MGNWGEQRTSDGQVGRHKELGLVEVDLGAVAFEAALDGAKELRGGQSIKDAVIEGERHVHHVADGNGVVLNDDGSLNHAIHRQNARVGLIDDRH